MTTPGQRDEAIGRLLKRADSSDASAGVCLDAELLARWAEGTLSSTERAEVAGHAADCRRCQAMLAAMVRTEPPAAREHGRSWTLVRWALPLSAAAAVVLWIAVDRAPERRDRGVSMDQMATSAPAPPPASPEAELQAPRAPAPVSQPAPRERDEPARRDRTNAQDRAARNEAAREQQQAAAEAAPPPGDTAAAAPVRPPAAPADTSVRTPLEFRGSAPAAPPPAAKQLPPPPQAVARQVPGGGLAETAAVAEITSEARRQKAPGAQPQVVWIDVPSPDPLVRWRFSRRGDVERSVDAGLTWTRDPLAGPRPDLLIGTAPSGSVCWLAGRDGVVLRYTAAQGWQRLSLPVRAHAVAIEATDAQNAAVTVPGQRFTTSDGGRTWR